MWCISDISGTSSSSRARLKFYYLDNAKNSLDLASSVSLVDYDIGRVKSGVVHCHPQVLKRDIWLLDTNINSITYFKLDKRLRKWYTKYNLRRC